jgi:hypothetical protein
MSLITVKDFIEMADLEFVRETTLPTGEKIYE